MMDYIDRKYISSVANTLERFKVNNEQPYTANFRCPYCGDSQKSKTRARAYLYERNAKIFYKCHNCHMSTNLNGFLKDNYPAVYKEYIFEVFKDQNNEKEQQEYVPDMSKFPKRRADIYLKGLKKISSLPLCHPARMYVRDRKIPPSQHYRLYWVDEFKHWVNTLIPEKFSEDSLTREEGRLVIPFIDANGYVFGATGRSLEPKAKVRYITIMLDERENKFFGLDVVDFKRKIYFVEGPIDSLFLNNSVAFAGSYGKVDNITDKSNAVIILDNEPRNKEIVQIIERYINDSYTVCIWPDQLEQKDINDMILSGFTEKQITDMINDNLYSGVMAKLRLTQWRKI